MCQHPGLRTEQFQFVHKYLITYLMIHEGQLTAGGSKKILSRDASHFYGATRPDRMTNTTYPNVFRPKSAPPTPCFNLTDAET
ncbi:uncharacterized protein ColSpa_10889 [Colletotrichum spaethianum]|uniref:Uncharacterized protein n=1 Tax=Colletotrichum spaethianum TaxID=700344 RepID=A0AA37PEA4_9PEZI|nr:uncharacterized protein ColSpa_10889 [Colletotrichum spaethianum]GKT50708.1 hypothetical protein ColSpa_10889 [Colletotrichum spaethianum]